MRSTQILGALLLTFAGLSLSNPDAQPSRTDLLRREAAPQMPTGGVGDAIEGETEPVEEEPAEEPKDTKKPDAKNTAKVTGSDTKDADKPTETDKSEKSGDSKDTKKPTGTKSIKIPITAQVGRVIMQTPGIFDPFSLYKIGETLTFGWNYTDLIVTPTAINIEAYAQDVGRNYFPISMNASADTTAVTWDTGKYQRDALTKLAVATYTLVISDASKGRNYVAAPGHLGNFQGHRFGLYTPKPYVPYNEFQCPTCDPSGAQSLMSKYVIRMYLGMAGIAVVSFSLFIAGAL